MMQRSSRSPIYLLAGLALVAIACKGAPPPKEPREGDSEESLVGARSNAEPEQSLEESIEEKFGKREELPPRAPAVEKCTGKGKKRTCKMVEPAPDVAAAYGARSLLKEYRWGMSPDLVMQLLSRDLEAEYEDRQARAVDAVEQDKNRDWRKEQLNELGKNRIRFDSASRHRWGVSLVQYDYEDDANEEMIQVRANPNLRKFFFFKDGELWKIIYAYSEGSFPGKTYQAIVDEEFGKWFGVSPEERVITEPKSGAPMVRFKQWKTKDGDIVRSFDMTAVHGAVVVQLIDSKTEGRIGERLPKGIDEGEMEGEVKDVLGGSDICYDKDGNLIDDAAKCKELGQ